MTSGVDIVNAQIQVRNPIGATIPPAPSPTELAAPVLAPCADLPTMPLLGHAKAGFVLRRANLADATGLTTIARPRAGDLCLAEVIEVRQQSRLQLTTERRSGLYAGDRVVVCFGNRYAPDQYEARVPKDLERCHLITAGGVAGRMVSRHSGFGTPTVIQPLGLLFDDSGEVINLRRYAQTATGSVTAPGIPIVGVLGTSMNSGKTTTATGLIRGLAASGLRVAAIKATGTGSGNDLWAMQDAGAHVVLDFVDMGYASTYRVPEADIERLLCDLVACAAQQDVDVIVLEIADGLLHKETAQLVASATFQRLVNNVVFCAGDALGARAGVEWLERLGLPVVAVSGAVTASPLGNREVWRATRLPVWTLAYLSAPSIAGQLGVKTP